MCQSAELHLIPLCPFLSDQYIQVYCVIKRCHTVADLHDILVLCRKQAGSSVNGATLTAQMKGEVMASLPGVRGKGIAFSLPPSPHLNLYTQYLSPTLVPRNGINPIDPQHLIKSKLPPPPQFTTCSLSWTQIMCDTLCNSSGHPVEKLNKELIAFLEEKIQWFSTSC